MPLFNNTNIGRPVRNSSIPESTAAIPKLASVAWVQIEVAKVLKFRGERIRVAGNSFIIKINTMANAPVNPGIIAGKLIVFQILKFDAPKIFADSSIFGFICESIGLITPMETGMKRIRYPMDNRTIV